MSYKKLLKTNANHEREMHIGKGRTQQANSSRKQVKKSMVRKFTRNKFKFQCQLARNAEHELFKRSERTERVSWEVKNEKI